MAKPLVALSSTIAFTPKAEEFLPPALAALLLGLIKPGSSLSSAALVCAYFVPS